MKKLSRLTRVSLLLAIFFAVDKLLSIVRQMLVSRQFRLTAEIDAFNSANNVPDMLAALIAGGALAIAFIPVLTEVLSQEGREKAWKLFSNILNLTFLVTAGLSILVAIFAHPIIKNLIAPGFKPEQVELAVYLLRMDLIATLIFSISGLVISGLQSNQHFLLPALAPIFYTLGQIFGAAVLAPKAPIHIGPVALPAFGFGVKGLVYGVIIGAILHLLIQVPGLIKYKFRWNPSLNLRDEHTLQVLRLMGPRVLSMVAIQLIFIINDNLASRLAAGSVTALMYGWWIMQVPETLIGTAIATAVLPTLSELVASKAFEEVRLKIEKAGRIMLALSIPVAIIAGIVLQPLVSRVFGFDAAETARVVEVSRVYLIGIIGHALVELFVRAFYSLQKPKYPTIGAWATMLIFLVLGVVLYRPLGALGIAIANTVAYALQAAFLYLLLNREFGKAVVLWQALLRGLAGAILGGALAFGVLYLRDGFIFAILAFLIGMGAAAMLIRKDLQVLANL